MEHTPSKRRQYAVDQTQAYNTTDAPLYDNTQSPQPQFINPAAVQQTAFETHQPQPVPYYHQSSQPSNPALYPQPDAIQGNPQMVNQLASGFSHMNINEKFSFQTVNLFAQLPDPRDLFRPPPGIHLPPNSTVLQSPHTNADPSYKRSTINTIPTTSSLLNKSKIPLGLVVTPYRTVKEGDDPVPVVTDNVIARCRRCRSYINPYVQFLEDGGRWKCCLCHVINDVPQLFDWDQERNVRADRWSRAELNHAVVEFSAPQEYMARPPQTPVYTFLIDVSHEAIQSGMTAIAAATILESLDRIPNEDNRTKIAFIAFDDSLYFFSLTPGCTDPPIMVVSDLEDIFLPVPTDLLVNLHESREAIESLLQRFSKIFQGSPKTGGAVGPALEAGFKLIQSLGGKLILLSSTLPTLGAGALKNREDSKTFGTPKESSLLQPASPFYKTFAISCARAHVSVDMFLFSSAYTDIATLGCLPRYTAGQTYFYPAFNAVRSEDARKFAHEFSTILASPIAFETIMRIRATKGIRLSMYHGNFFISSSDLLTLPTLPVDQSYVIEMQIEETITSPFVLFQTALVITTCFGERRIRVVNLALPTTTNMSEMYSSVDEIALTSYFATKAVEKTLSHRLEDARDSITNRLIEILTAYKDTMTSSGAGASSQLAICDNMKMFPLLCLGLLKHVAIRQSSQTPSDLRAYGHALLTTFPPQQLIPYIHANFYSLHNMPPEAGMIGDYGVILPAPLPLTSERLEGHGLYLIEDGQNIFLWVGRQAVTQLIHDVFNLPSLALLHSGKATLPLLDNPFSTRINAIIGKIREMRRGPYWQHLYIVKEDGEPALRHWALSSLIMDSIEQLPSYQQYLARLREKVNGSN